MADIAIFRINYKSDFILTLESDAGWATPFCIKFWTGAPSKAYYAYYDGISYTHCTPVEDDPTKLLVQFDDHHLPIGDLKFQIGYHFTVADFPTSVEDEFINQATVIIENDGEPAQVMLDFNGETAPEIEFALPAYANEAQRIANEQARIAAEEQRVNNEEARITAEQTRQQNEQQRISNEAARVREFARLKTQSEAATAAATTAANTADASARNADDKAALAQSAATLANEKAQLAADKAALAQSAATLANDKAQLAEDKANLAQQKADYAQTQGNYAKEQGDAAKTEAEAAHALNEEVRTDEDARKQAEQTRQQQEAARQQAETARQTAYEQAEAGRNTSFQQAEADRTTAFNNQLQQQQTAYTEAEAARQTAFNEAETERDAKVDEKVADITNLQAQVGYFVCDTAAATASKTIAATGYVLTTGGNIRIKMTNANTADAVTLNINNTGAKALFYNDAQASSTNSWEAGEVVEVYYDGTQFQCASSGGGKFATGENVKETRITNHLEENDSSLVTGGVVFDATKAGYKLIPFPTVYYSPNLISDGTYSYDTPYSGRSEIPVDAGTTLIITGDPLYSTTAVFLTQSDATLGSGDNASITADGKFYTIEAGESLTLKVPLDAKFLCVNTYYGTGSDNTHRITPQLRLVLDINALSRSIDSVEKKTVYGSNTTNIDVSNVTTHNFSFNSDGRYFVASSTRHYRLNVKAGCEYVVSAGEDVLYVGFLKSDAGGEGRKFADLSIYDGSVYTVSSGQTITVLAPKDAVRMIFSAIPASIVEINHISVSDELDTHTDEIEELQEDVSLLKVPITPIPIPSTSYTRNITDKGSWYGNYKAQHSYISVLPNDKLRVIGNVQYTTYCAFVTQLEKEPTLFANALLTSDNKVYTINANESIDIIAPYDAVYLCFNVHDESNDIAPQQIGYVVSLEEFILSERTPETIFDFNPDWEIRNKLLQAKRKLNLNGSGGSGVVPLLMLHLSDIHSDKKSWDRMIEFKTKYREYIDDAICTGDIVDNTIVSDKTFLENGCDGVMLSLGNHDCAKSSWNKHDTTSQECYEALFEPYIENWGVTYEVNKCYYYKDYTEQKIRLIVLDTTIGYNESNEHWNSTQMSWFEACLSEARTNGYHVIVAQHYWAVKSSGRTYVDCTFTCKNPLGEGEAIIPSEAIDAVQAFINDGGIFICWLSGHTHRDFVYYPTAYPKQLGLVVDCASGYGAAKNVCDEDRQAGTKSIDAFNIYAFDTTRKIIKVIRIGSDTDSLMRHKGTLTLKYGGDTPEVIYND